MKLLRFLSVLLSLAVLHADDFTTLDGEHYKGTVKQVELDGIVVRTADGVSKLKFKNLPSEVGSKYGYSPYSAAVFEAKQLSNVISVKQSTGTNHSIQATSETTALSATNDTKESVSSFESSSQTPGNVISKFIITQVAQPADWILSSANKKIIYALLALMFTLIGLITLITYKFIKKDKKDLKNAAIGVSGKVVPAIVKLIKFILIIVTGTIVMVTAIIFISESGSNSSEDLSESFKIGYSLGKSAGEEDARRKYQKMGPETLRENAERDSTQNYQLIKDRHDYVTGWTIGYSSGYDSYSK